MDIVSYIAVGAILLIFSIAAWAVFTAPPVEPGICPGCRVNPLPEGKAECDQCFGNRQM